MKVGQNVGKFCLCQVTDCYCELWIVYPSTYVYMYFSPSLPPSNTFILLELLHTHTHTHAHTHTHTHTHVRTCSVHLNTYTHTHLVRACQAASMLASILIANSKSEYASPYLHCKKKIFSFRSMYVLGKESQTYSPIISKPTTLQTQTDNKQLDKQTNNRQENTNKQTNKQTNKKAGVLFHHFVGRSSPDESLDVEGQEGERASAVLHAAATVAVLQVAEGPVVEQEGKGTRRVSFKVLARCVRGSKGGDGREGRGGWEEKKTVRFVSHNKSFLLFFDDY